MVVFPWGAIIASNMSAARRSRERREREEEERQRRIEEEKRKQPFKNKTIIGFQIYIYPVYARTYEEVNKTEEDGQINILEKDYIPVDIIKGYYVNDGYSNTQEVEKYFRNDK